MRKEDGERGMWHGVLGPIYDRFPRKKIPWDSASSQLGSCSSVICSSETGLGGLQPVDIFGPAMQVNVIQGNKLQGSVVWYCQRWIINSPLLHEHPAVPWMLLQVWGTAACLGTLFSRITDSFLSITTSANESRQELNLWLPTAIIKTQT